MRLLSTALTALLALSSPVSAVFADEAYNVDYHHALIGKPLANSTFFAPPYPGSKGSLIYSLSDAGVVGAVNPKDGVLVWRQQLASDTTSAGALDKILRGGDGHDVVVAAVSNVVSAWGASDGKLAWQKTFDEGAAVKDVQLLGAPSFEQTARSVDVAVLVDRASAGAVIVKIDGTTGQELWTHADASGDAPFRLAYSAGKGLSYLSVSKAMLKGYKIKITALGLDGSKAGDSPTTLSSESEISSPQDDVLFSGSAAVPAVVWTDSARSTIKLSALSGKSVVSVDVKAKGVESISVQAPTKGGAASHFLIGYQTAEEHWAEVYHLDVSKGAISKAYDLPKLGGHGAFAASTVDNLVYFTRTTQHESTLYGSSSHGILARTPIALQFDLAGLQGGETPRPVHAASDVISRADNTFAVRSAILLSTGDWVLDRNGAIDWTRHEGLANIVEAAYGNWKQETVTTAEAEIAKEEELDLFAAFIHRLARHFQLLVDLADVLPQLPQQILSWVEAVVTPGSYDARKDISFGFNQLVVVLTRSNRVVALEANNKGRVVFSRQSPCSGGLAAQVECIEAASASTPSLQVATPARSFEAESVGRLTYSVSPAGVFGVQKSEQSKGKELWSFRPLAGQTVIGVAHRLASEPVASIGKALADRSVLYKYLNPNAIVITAVDAAKSSASFYLVDAVSGTELYAAHHSNVDTSRPITSLISENWFTYSFTGSPTTAHLPAGPQIIMAELYESAIPNDRGPLGAEANFSYVDPAVSGQPVLPHVVAQAFILPREITSMAVSQTSQGITSRMLLVSAGHALVGIPRQVLDPRRTIGKAPSNAQQAEEGLTQYFPLVDLNPQWYLSHKRDIDVRAILTNPSSMESTSLVFAHGLDLFGTRVSPSFIFDILGASFNKVQLGLTIVALVAGVVGVAPIVGRKSVNALWTSPT